MRLVMIKKSIKIKNFDYYIAFIGYILVALFIMRLILLDPGTIGFFHDWSIGPYPEMNNVFTGSAFYIWDEQYGNKPFPTDWLTRVALYLPFSFLGGEVLSKGFLVSVLALSGFTSYCLGRRIRSSWWELIINRKLECQEVSNSLSEHEISHIEFSIEHNRNIHSTKNLRSTSFRSDPESDCKREEDREFRIASQRLDQPIPASHGSSVIRPRQVTSTTISVPQMASSTLPTAYATP